LLEFILQTTSKESNKRPSNGKNKRRTGMKGTSKKLSKPSKLSMTQKGKDFHLLKRSQHIRNLRRKKGKFSGIKRQPGDKKAKQRG